MQLFVYKARVLSVYDGDTMTVDIDLGFGVWIHKQKLRLKDIDTPEIRTKDLEEKKLGYQARDFVRERIAKANNEVWLRSFGKGKYGRWIADVYPGPPDKVQSLNQLLVGWGLAERKEY